MKKITKEILSKVSEVKVSYHPKMKLSEMELVKCSRDSARILRQHWDAGSIHLIEEFKIMLLNRAGRVKGIHLVSRGGINGTVVDPRIVLITALGGLAESIILSHNHPSGRVAPSNADIEVTKKIKKAASHFDLKVLDHIILGEDEYLSFADEGLL